MKKDFSKQLRRLKTKHKKLLDTKNKISTDWYNGWFERWHNPVITADHVPLDWRFDLSPKRNPLLLERMAVNAAFNCGAMEWKGRIVLSVRLEGSDRKSFFAIAESRTGVDQFEFWDKPISMPETDLPDTNVYDMRLVRHEDGWVYGIFCTERKDPTAPQGDLSSAIAQCGIARTKDLVKWERLPDLKSRSNQQRNVVLHPEFIKGKYLLYTRPQDDFIQAGSGSGICWALASTMERAEIGEEKTVDPRVYHTIKECKNGLGPAPIRTSKGWLHLAHGVRNTAAGLRYVVYLFLADINQPWRVTHAPGGLFIGPQAEERIGDVSNVVFSNGWVAKRDGRVFIYYGASDTRTYVATTTLERLLDYVINTPQDGLRSAKSVQQRLALIEQNRQV